MKVNSLKRNDPCFPDILNQIPSPPKEIFILGSAFEEWIDLPKVAIVGARKVSGYGKEVTQRLASDLAASGVVVISGLALGTDSIAHKSALDAGGITIAVMPGGLDKVYPASHTNLARQILLGRGALVSEYPNGASVYKQNFVARNRIVSGLADALLVTEAAAASGTIHTARFALDQGKTVMAVPGNITSPMSEGTNNLIKSGALAVTSADDILFALGVDPVKKKQQRLFKGSPLESKALKLIADGTGSQEELAVLLNIDGSQLGPVLTMLEINGYIRPAGGGFWLAV